MAGIAGDLRELAATEVKLAKAELGEQAVLAKNIAIFGGVALVAAMLGLLFVFVTDHGRARRDHAVAGRRPAHHGPAAADRRRRRAFRLTKFKQLTVVPKKTIRSVREDVRWAKEQLRSSVS